MHVLCRCCRNCRKCYGGSPGTIDSDWLAHHWLLDDQGGNPLLTQRPKSWYELAGGSELESIDLSYARPGLTFLRTRDCNPKRQRWIGI